MITYYHTWSREKLQPEFIHPLGVITCLVGLPPPALLLLCGLEISSNHTSIKSHQYFLMYRILIYWAFQFSVFVFLCLLFY